MGFTALDWASSNKFQAGVGLLEKAVDARTMKKLAMCCVVLQSCSGGSGAVCCLGGLHLLYHHHYHLFLAGRLAAKGTKRLLREMLQRNMLFTELCTRLH